MTRSVTDCIDSRAAAASLRVVARVRREVRARLTLAALFGSRARGDARPDSDVDLLLLFARLPPGREPQATRAERIAAEVESQTGVPVAVWSVSRDDLRRGRRTPMLVDALADAVPLWPEGGRIPRVRFTPADARFCAGCLLDRVLEGAREVTARRAAGAHHAASVRARDDVVRLCTAALLMEGLTRPRRAEAVAAFRRRHPDLAGHPALAWAERSYQLDPAAAAPPRWRDLAGLIDRVAGRVRGAGLASPGERPAAAPDRILRIAP
jgi:uncharacterized protein